MRKSGGTSNRAPYHHLDIRGPQSQPGPRTMSSDSPILDPTMHPQVPPALPWAQPHPLTHVLLSMVSNQLPQFKIPSNHCHLEWGTERWGGPGTGSGGRKQSVPRLAAPSARPPQTFTPETALPLSQLASWPHLPDPSEFFTPPPPPPPTPDPTAPDLEGGLSIVILHVLAGPAIEEDPSTGLLKGKKTTKVTCVGTAPP